MSAVMPNIAELTMNQVAVCREALLDQIPERLYSEPSIWLYRHRTIAMLRRYLRLSIEVGRMPSLLGREFFRSKITAYKASSFEDSVIFVHDVEKCLDKLDGFEKRLIATIVLQEYTHDEAAVRLQCWRRTVGRRFPEAIDALSELFLKGGLLRRLAHTESEVKKSCQEGKIDEFSASDSEEAK
jgi:DNA-directed RNA polymerase specialized sigma24 family protein